MSLLWDISYPNHSTLSLGETTKRWKGRKKGGREEGRKGGRKKRKKGLDPLNFFHHTLFGNTLVKFKATMNF
jgi:hypothetical protein